MKIASVKTHYLILSTLFLIIVFNSRIALASSHFERPTLEELGSADWVRSKLKLYPELEWLLDERVHHTQEGNVEQFPHSWSKQIRGRHYPEFERTMLSLVCLYLIADGSKAAYERFTILQPVSEKLSYDSFQRLHHYAHTVIQDNLSQLKALEVNLILGDMGKTKIAHEKAEKCGIFEVDHDLFLDECLEKCSNIFPTFEFLPPLLREQIQRTKDLVHLGHVTHVEGGPEILTKLKHSGILKNNPQGFDFEMLTHICDVSAARGHEDNKGSKVLTENAFKAIEAVKDTLHYLANHTEQEALQQYLTIRAQWLGLNQANEETYILARIGAMMRLFTQEEGNALKEAFARIDEPQQKEILSEFDPLVYRKERTPTYIPAVLVNIMSAYIKQGLSKEVALKKCVQKGIPFIVHILHQYRNNKANLTYNPDLTLNFNKMAGQLRDHPDLIQEAAFAIDLNGIVNTL